MVVCDVTVTRPPDQGFQTLTFFLITTGSESTHESLGSVHTLDY